MPESLYGPKHSLALTRGLAKKAYQFAKDHDDLLIMSRARLHQARVEQQAAACEEDPVRAVCFACQYAIGAASLAGQMHNERLQARCHTLLCDLYLGYPFRNVIAASREWEAAVRCMSPHADMDYLVEKIQTLRNRLDSAPCAAAVAVIFTVTAGDALDHPLEGTVQAVGRAVVLAALERLGDNDRVICQALGTGRKRIEKHLSAPALPGSGRPGARDPDDPVIFRVTAALAFSQPLEDTIQAVERAIIRAACIRYGCDQHAVRESLCIGYERFIQHFAALGPELRLAGCAGNP